MHPVIKLSAGRFPANETAIGQFEFRHSLKLPAGYRRFLLETNGGGVEGEYSFEISEKEGATTLGRFFRIVDSTRSTASLEYYHSLYASRLPKNLIAIAGDLGSGKVCLGVRGQETHKVYFWDPQMDFEDTHDGSFENIIEVAHTFEEFLARLSRRS
jgi:hypothetical protein